MNIGTACIKLFNKVPQACNNMYLFINLVPTCSSSSLDIAYKYNKMQVLSLCPHLLSTVQFTTEVGTYLSWAGKLQP